MLINYKNVNVFQEDKLILENVNFNVDESEFVYLIGRVGSGKSSLLKTIYAELDLYEDECEEATVLGRDMARIKTKDIPALRKEMGIIFQDFKLLSDRTVKQNLEFVLKATGWKIKERRENRIDEVLELVGMKEKKDVRPHELSGGEQQRVAIARALLNAPKMILADEPTGNLDPETATQIITLLKDITRTGTAIVMSTHNLPMLEKFPGIVYKCEDGKFLLQDTEKTKANTEEAVLQEPVEETTEESTVTTDEATTEE